MQVQYKIGIDKKDLITDKTAFFPLLFNICAEKICKLESLQDILALK